jgi:hypothetical protein
MLVAKGITQPDGTYLWQCNKCNERNPDCDWCYGLNTSRIIEEMNKGARGQRYYALLKAFLSVSGKAMVDCAHSTHEPDGKMSPVGVGFVALKFGLNFKATCEWLEETHCIRAGAYDYIMSGNLTQVDGTKKRVQVRDIYDAVREKFGDRL